jgi:hypothetical protein
MKERNFLFFAIFAALVFALEAAPYPNDDLPGSRRPSKFSLEICGGFTAINPRDFNLLASYEEAYIQFYSVQYFAYLKGLYGDSYMTTFDRIGDSRFKILKCAFPFGLRVKYMLDKAVAFSIGLQYISGAQSSVRGVAVQVRDLRRDAIEYPWLASYDYEDSVFSLSAKAWIPQAGVHIGADLREKLRLEGFLTAGPMFASCCFVKNYHVKMSEQSGFWSRSDYSIEMKGKGVGLALEFGGQIRMGLSNRFDIFAEGSYGLRKTGEMTGPGRSTTAFKNINAVSDADQYSRDGTWRVVTINFWTYWGEFKEKMAGPGFSAGPWAETFRLDLAGFQMKAGLALRF